MSEAILFVSFGGPDQSADVMPFLENVTRGRGVPPERLREVAEHYEHFGGRSPINDQNRAMIAELKVLLAREGPQVPVYWGNRNWQPYLGDALRQMKADGVTRAYAFVTSAFSSYSGCRQYRENIAAAQQEADSHDMEILKLRVYYNHPGFIDPLVERTREQLRLMPHGRLIFTAHSIPVAMAAGCDYEVQLRDASALVATACERTDFDLVWQSRSGPPSVPWLEPDILDHLQLLKNQGMEEAILIPIGFVSDHMEVLFDLDTEAAELAGRLGMGIRRVSTPGNDPRFIRMIRDLVIERMGLSRPQALGVRGPNHDVCPNDCCPAPPARPAR